MDDARHLVLPSDLTSSLHPSRECPGPHGQDAGWIHAEITRPVVLIVLVLAGQTGVKNTCEDDQLRLVHRVRELDDVEVAIQAGLCFLDEFALFIEKRGNSPRE